MIRVVHRILTWNTGSIPPSRKIRLTQHLIEPLQKHQAVLNINFVPGFVNDEKKSIEAAWTQDFTDQFGANQDFISGKRGYDKGIKLGVFEVMCHGLTHMQPDLVSEPGWYGAPYDQEKAEVGWYREFGDTRRQSGDSRCGTTLAHENS